MAGPLPVQILSLANGQGSPVPLTGHGRFARAFATLLAGLSEKPPADAPATHAPVGAAPSVSPNPGAASLASPKRNKAAENGSPVIVETSEPVQTAPVEQIAKGQTNQTTHSLQNGRPRAGQAVGHGTGEKAAKTRHAPEPVSPAIPPESPVPPRSEIISLSSNPPSRDTAEPGSSVVPRFTASSLSAGGISEAPQAHQSGSGVPEAPKPDAMPSNPHTVSRDQPKSETVAIASAQVIPKSDVISVGPEMTLTLANCATESAASQILATAPEITEAPAVNPAAVAAPVETAAPADQLAPALVGILQSPDDTQSVTVSLRPPELGHVLIKVDHPAGGGTKVDITVERPETLQLLQRDQPKLEQVLDHAGASANGRNITFQVAVPEQASARVSQPGISSSDFNGAGQHQSGGGRDRHGESTGNPGGDQNPRQGSPRTRWFRAGLDITA